MTVEHFHLDPPTGFSGLDPDKPIHMYHRHLPRWRQEGATYFVTFRLADSIPQAQLKALKRWRRIWERAHPEPRSEGDWRALASQITRKTEAWLDKGYGECVFSNRECSRQMETSLVYFQEERCVTSCYCVMPNHVHAVMKPVGGFELEEILESIKKYVSRKINAMLGRRGNRWQPESYDRIVRDEQHLYQVIQYIGRNPAMADMPQEQWCRWIRPDWEAAHWRFPTAQ